jgi:CheY-like chemotaxis protein
MEAVKMASTTDLNVILMNVQMPKLIACRDQSFQDVVCLQKHPANHCLDANALTGQRQTYLEAGMND